MPPALATPTWSSATMGASSRSVPTSPPRTSSSATGASSLPDLSTCTRTSANPARRRPRRSRADRAPPLSAASPPSSPCPTPSRPSTARPSCAKSSSSDERPDCATWSWPAPSRWAGPVNGWRPSARWPRSACGCSPTTATACRTAASCGGRSSTRAASVSPSRSTVKTPRWPRAVTCTKASGRAASDWPDSRPRRRS